MHSEERPREVHQADAPEGHGFDRLVKGLASGTISRGRMLKLAGSAVVGAVVAVRQLPRMALAQEGCTT